MYFACWLRARVFVRRGGGGRQSVQFKGKIQGTQSWEGRQAGRQQERQARNLLSWLTLLQRTNLWILLLPADPERSPPPAPS